MPTQEIDDKMVREALQAISLSRCEGQRIGPLRGHPFPARMPLPLTEQLIAGLTAAGATVLDPMVGSGTTIIAAKKLGRKGIGIDRDPLAVRIASAAVSTYDRDALKGIAPAIMEKARWLVRQSRIDIRRHHSNLAKEDQRFLRYWFPLKSRCQLLALVKAIESTDMSPAVRDFALVIISSLIIAKAAGASYALDIARSRPHKVLDKTIAYPFELWPRRFSAAISRHLFFKPGTGYGTVRVCTGDARSLPVESDTADLVLTSPPYLNAIDYLRAHKFSLVWMGHDLQQLRELRATMVGTERGLLDADGLPAGIEKRLHARCAAKELARVRRYLFDLGKTLAEISRVLKPGRLAIVVAGPTIINQRKSDASELLASIGDQHGLQLVHSVVRRINSQRRSLPLPSVMGTSNPLSRRMRREVLIALRKV